MSYRQAIVNSQISDEALLECRQHSLSAIAHV
jgi:hypothetical protein